MSAFFSPNPNVQQQRALLEMRRRLLPRVLGVTAVFSLFYLAGWRYELYDHALLPLDGLFLLALSIVCYGLMWLPKFGVSMSAAFFIAGFVQPIFFATQYFGINAPTTALFLVSISLTGLLIGGWFLTMFIAFFCFWVGFVGYQELQGEYFAPNPLQTMPAYLASGTFWCGLFIFNGWITRLLARHLEQMTQLARGQTNVQNRILTALMANAQSDTFLREAIGSIAEQLGVQWATLFFHNQEADLLEAHLYLANGEVRSAANLNSTVPPVPTSEVPLWQELVRHKQPILINDVANDPRLVHRDRILADGIRQILQVPLLEEDQVIGLMSFNSSKKQSFWPEDIELAQLLAQQVMLGMRLNRLTEEVAEQAEETAVANERNRMAREIHDTLAQGFTGIVVQLEAAEDTLLDEPDVTQNHLARARSLAKESLAEARRSVWALRPPALESSDLPTALRQMLDRIIPGTMIHAQVTVKGEPYPLPPQTETELLRIAQEAVTNALKHAKPTAVSLSLTYDPEQLMLLVQDNGQGFNPAQPSAGFGLTSMRERAMKINGRLNVNMRTEGGTDVVCVVNRS
jgi:signal transduction histidine kinase